jgi:hypothetical protein
MHLTLHLLPSSMINLCSFFPYSSTAVYISKEYCSPSKYHILFISMSFSFCCLKCVLVADFYFFSVPVICKLSLYSIMLQSPNVLSTWNYFIVEAEYFLCHECKNSFISRKHNKGMPLIIGSALCFHMNIHTSVTISNSSHSVQHYHLTLI